MEQEMQQTYSIADVVLITGLSERTVRSHIAAGFLQGEKHNGAWRFTREEIESFVTHSAVRPGILARKNALVYDFMLQDKKSAPEACIILDIEKGKGSAAAEFFCRRISTGTEKNIRFSYDGVKGANRVILRGDIGAVLAIVNEYWAKQ